MLSRIVGLSLQYRGSVVALALLLSIYGVYLARQSKLDVFPDFVPPQVTVQAESPGFSAEEVEALVTRPIENAMNGVIGLQSLRSESIQGLSIVTANFEENVSVILARQLLGEKLAALAGQLPAGVKPPKMTPLTSATMDLLKIGLQSTHLSPRQLRTFADWTLVPRLLAVPGVAKASVFGGEVRQFQVQVIPERLVLFNLSLANVVASVRAATGIRAAGFIETAQQRITVQSLGQTLTTEELGEMIIAQPAGSNAVAGASLRLRDIARVIEGAEPKFGDALIQGGEGVLLTMSSQFGANTLDTTRAVEAALDEMRPLLKTEGIALWPRLHRPATFIENALKHMRRSLLWGAVFVAAVLFLFLFNFRTALISLAAIPLSLLGPIILLSHWGVTLNMMSLGGLLIAIGEVVDDAIIDVENIFRRLGETSEEISFSEKFGIVLSSSLEVRSAVVYATFIVVLVFLPVLMLSGLQGSFFKPLAMAYVLAIITSLLVALTVTPALCLWLLKPGARAQNGPRWISGLKRFYVRAVTRFLRFPVLLGGLALLLCAGAILSLRWLGMEFLPEFREGHFVAQLSMAPGISLPEMKRLGGAISRDLLANPKIATVEEQIGRAEAGEDPWGPNRSEFHIELRANLGSAESEAQEEIRATLESYPGVRSEVLTFLGDRISESISGETAQVVINIFGEDLEELDARAVEIADILHKIPGHADVRARALPGSPRLQVKLKPVRLREFGFTSAEVLDSIETAIQGTSVAQVFSGETRTDVVVTLEPSSRNDPEDIGNLWMQNANGLRVPLRELAEIDLTEARGSILHDGGRRRQTVTCNVTGRDVGSFSAEVKRQCNTQLHLPKGYYLAFGGVAEQQQDAIKQLLTSSGIAAFGIILLLSIVLKSTANLIIVSANLPFALAGSIVALWITSGSLSLGALVGFVTVFGITLRNSIMLISHVDFLITKEGASWTADTMVRAASERLVPILMTALVAALGLLPLAVSGNKPGQEIESPMAIVILGGLASSTILNLLLMPSLLWRFGKFTKPSAPIVRQH
ncbi:MAG TPA: efflux RND transporter permease subunit [Verrucomicrobiae bacterium]|nr:efflux RND transporter permease subunit [Verrucomicrobiae bacterium]